jgi:hypothetical protein
LRLSQTTAAKAALPEDIKPPSIQPRASTASRRKK